MSFRGRSECRYFYMRSQSKFQTKWEISSNFCGLLRKPDLYRGSSRKSWYNLANQGTPATFPRSIPYSPQNLCQIPLILKWIQMWCQRNDLLLPHLLLRMTKVQIFGVGHNFFSKILPMFQSIIKYIWASQNIWTLNLKTICIQF